MEIKITAEKGNVLFGLSLAESWTTTNTKKSSKQEDNTTGQKELGGDGGRASVGIREGCVMGGKAARNDEETYCDKIMWEETWK